MIKSTSILGTLILALNLLALSIPTHAQETVGGGGGVDCKWIQMTCSGGTEREVCLEIGDGNACTCGSVTRPC